MSQRVARASFSSRSTRLRPSVFLLLVSLLLPAVGHAADADAEKIARRVVDAMGGEEAWSATRYLRFNFFGFRTHHWDRYTGRHRLEGQNREGQKYVVLHNIQTREGQVWVDGALQTAEEAGTWLERAYGAWINDTYWLLMPYKLLDPGTQLTLDGQETIDGTTYDKLKLTFEQVGLTPGDTYWAYINRDTGLMDQWAYHLESWEADRAPQVWEWRDWQRYGAIMLAPHRHDPAAERDAMLDDIAVFDTLADSVFTSPDAVASGE